MRLLSFRKSSHKALTLIELVIVLGILGIVAGVVSFAINPNTMTFVGSGRGRTTPQIVTESTISGIKEAILGAPGAPGYWADMNKINAFFPQYTVQLFAPATTWSAFAPTNLSAYTGFTWYQELLTFNPATGKGWRGPYLTSTGKYPYTASAAARGFTTSFQPVGFANYPVPIDGWGNPIIIQLGVPAPPLFTVDLNAFVQEARLISAGPNGILDCTRTDNTGLPILKTYADFVADRQPGGQMISGDDIVSFFFWPALP